MFNSRYLVYGIFADGSKEFLHSMLGEEGAMSYVNKHSNMFKRYVAYDLYVADSFRKRIELQAQSSQDDGSLCSG